MKSEAEIISQAMGFLGRRTSPKKAEAVRRNGEATRFKAKPLAEIECKCSVGNDGPDADHKTYCPRGRAYRRRQKAASIASA
jgi:hypothetical protein